MDDRIVAADQQHKKAWKNMNCPRCQTSNPSQARFCLNCGFGLVRRCSNCGSELLPDARFCMQCGQPVMRASPVDDSRFSRIAAAAPEDLVEKMRAAAALEGERRVATILFIDVVGSTAISTKVDVEAWSKIMNDHVDGIIPIIYRYEGTIARLLGDSLLVFFGAPLAHEDDPVRAVMAALEVIEFGQGYADLLRDQLNVSFALRACIHTGTVVINAVREDLKVDFRAMGGAVNLTSLIKFAAQPMTVLITEETYRFVQPFFDCTALESVHVKGHQEPQAVYRVDGRRAQPGTGRGIQGLFSPMVGREKELAYLVQLCDAVRAGLGRGVLIVGEPGIGKTRLIAEWKAAVEAEKLPIPALWVEGRGLSFGKDLAYHLLIDLVRSLLGIPYTMEEAEARAAATIKTRQYFGESMMEVYPYLGHLLSLELESGARQMVNLSDPQVLRNQVYHAVRLMLLAVSSRQPVVIILEDLHWADPSSVDILVRLLPLANAGSILFCMVTRDERDAPGWRLVNVAREILGNNLAEIALKPLSEKDSRKMVSNLLQIESLPERVRRIILDKSEGNPFFVEEVIRMLIAREAILQENGGWVACNDFDTIEIPDNLNGLLLARIDRLPEEVKMVLRVAAIIGRKFSVRVLERVIKEQLQ